MQELLEDHLVTLDDQGRRSVSYRYVFRIDQASAIENWSTVEASYTTWLDEKPIIRARVITPDGAEHFLDPATIGEYSPEQRQDTFSDRRDLKAPLPKLTQGALAEVEVLYRQHRPFSLAGVSGTHTLWQRVPVAHERFRLEAPAAAPLVWKLRGLPGLQPRVRNVEGRTVLTLDLGAIRPIKKDEPNQAPAQEPKPAFAYSTTPSWGLAAAEYSSTVEAQLKDAQLTAWVQQAVGGATDRLEVIRRLVARMHKEVRYTGLEFGDASVVPRTPQDTLKRGYGDCKDQSALLVALLREAGITAHLALLRIDDGREVDPDLPGLSLFDHAIVHVPGTPALWIDPTVPEAPVGELPSADLGRAALVIAPASPGLLTIPEATADRNVQRETMEVFLADDGPGRLLETTEGQGPTEIHLRSEYAGADTKNARENLKGYLERAYKAKEAGRMEFAHPEDLTQPFKVVLEGKLVGVANTGSTDAAVSMNAWPLVANLSTILQDGAKDEGEGAAKDAEKPRRTDLQLWAAYAREARWLVHPPAGYAYDAMPADQTVAIGPASLTLTYKGLPDGSVEALYRMQCPTRRWKPAEVDQGRAALKAFGDTKIPMVVFQQVGEAHLGAGRTREALAEFRKLRAASPDQAAPLVRLARAQFAAGLAETARTSLTEAVRLEPTYAKAFEAQGWILQHDRIGRRFMPGWDRKGAIAAYRKAIPLTSENRYARYNLAILLEYDADGNRYVPGPDLDEAIRLYRTLLAEAKADDLQDNLMVALARSGQFAESQEIARAREAGSRRNAWVLGLEGCLRGLDSALALGRTLFPDLATRRAAYQGAAEVAMTYRHYPEAAGLLDEGASGASDMTQVKARAEMLARIRPWVSTYQETQDPGAVVKGFCLALTDWNLSATKFKPFIAEAQLTPALVDKALRTQRKALAKLRDEGLTTELMADIASSLGEVAVDGNALKGYQVRFQMPGQDASRYYVARLGTSCRIVGDELSDLARQSLWFLEQGDLPAARVWLDLLWEESKKPTEGDPLSGHIIRCLWEKGRAGTAEEIRLAAVCAMVPGKGEDKALATLLKASGEPLPDLRLSAVLRCEVLVASKRKDRAAEDRASARLLALFPQSKVAQNQRLNCLGSAGRWAESLPLLETMIAATPDDPNLPARKAYVLGKLGRVEEMDALMVDLVARGKVHPTDYNNLAWSQVVRGKIDARTLDYARRGILGDGATTAAGFHTLATVLAETGRTAEALDVLRKAVALREEEAPTASEWYVLGRIAEQLGEIPAARTYYQRVEAEKTEEDQGPDSCLALARRRMALL